MTEIGAYLLVVAVVLGINLLPAFGPPTWAVLVLLSLHHDFFTPALVLCGAIAAAGGRWLLALATRRLRAHVRPERRENLRVASELLTRRPGRSLALVGFFLVSPLPSAQLFEAAGLLSVRLGPLIGAFGVGRLITYSLYLGGASALSSTDTGKVLLENLTSPWAVALEVVMLAALVALARVDWAGLAARAGRRH